MDNFEEVFARIKVLCSSISESTYNNGVQQGYEMLIKLHDLGYDQDCVYQSLLQYHSGLEEGLSRDCFAEIMDFAVGWCSRQKRIWDADEIRQ